MHENNETKVVELQARVYDLECINKELSKQLRVREERQEKAKSTLKSWWICIAFFLVISVA